MYLFSAPSVPNGYESIKTSKDFNAFFLSLFMLSTKIWFQKWNFHGTLKFSIQKKQIFMDRSHYLEAIRDNFNIFPIIALLGPRQVGKTTLAKMFRDKFFHNEDTFYLDLEDPTDLAKLENPKQLLQGLNGLIIIDEIQLRPNLFSILRVLVDNTASTQKYLILGSASRDLINQSSETLAGRICYIEITPFSLGEASSYTDLLARGGFPKSFLSKSNKESFIWRKEYIRSFFERDIPQLGLKVPAKSLYKLWQMLVHYHGNIINYSELGRSLSISDTTAKKYIDILEGTFVLRQLQPWHVNIKKRQVKNPKIYFRDSGICNALLGTTNIQELSMHPKIGAIFEGFVIEEVTRLFKFTQGEVFFWATHNQLELDLLLSRSGKRYGMEMKYTDAPKITKSIRLSMEDLNLDGVAIIYPGKDFFVLDEKIIVVGITSNKFLNLDFWRNISDVFAS